MKTVQATYRLRRLAEEIALFSPDLAQALCQNAIAKLDPNDRSDQRAWLEALLPKGDDSGALFS